MRRRSRARTRAAGVPTQNLLTPSLGATNLIGAAGRNLILSARPVSSSPSPPRSTSGESGGSGSSQRHRPNRTTVSARRPSTSPTARLRSLINPGGGSNTAARALARSTAAAASSIASTPSSRRGGSGSRARRPITSTTHGSSQTVGVGGRSRRRPTAGTPSSPSRNSILSTGSRPKNWKKKGRSKSHVSFAVMPESSARTVMTQEKYVGKILSFLNWNELNAARSVSKQWLQLVGTDPGLQAASGVITITKSLNEAFKVFNQSNMVWTKFRIMTNIVFDLTTPVQSEFWWKHGATMQFLEIRNSAMTLSSLVEILSRTTNLVHFLVTWTAEMYSFNSELIRKYYGIHFRNGTFSKMESLTIERSSFLTDNALWSILKWCGSALHSLTLSCGPDEKDDNLSRLKPRWTLDPIENFASRFGYSGNFRLLDFSGSNLMPLDLARLADMDKLSHLQAIRLSKCKINDDAMVAFLLRKGSKLEELYVDFTPVTDAVFNLKENKELKLPKLRVLSISGSHSFRSFNFIADMPSLEEFYCADTSWLTTSMITKPLELHAVSRPMKKLDLSSNEKLATRNADLSMCHIWFVHLTTVLSGLTELDVSNWAHYATDANFKPICNNIPLLRKLRLRGWKDLSDEGVTGITYQELAEFEEIRKDMWRTIESHTKTRPLIAKLKHLELLDLSRCVNLSDMSIQFGILSLPNLRALSLNGTQVSDAGIHVLIAKSKTLDKLSLFGCERITPKGRRVHRLDGRAVFFANL